MRRLAAAFAIATLAACAPTGPAGTGAPDDSPRMAGSADAAPLAAAIARQQGLAQAATQAGDLATAAAHYEALVLLDPGNSAHRQALDATRTAIERTVRERSAAAVAARRTGDNTKARDAWLRVLALDPSNADAAKGLRELEQQAMARQQASRASRVRAMDEAASNRAGSAPAVPSADLEQCIELVRSGQPPIALREARSWADGNAADRAGRQRLAAELLDRGRELEAKGQRDAALGFYDLAKSLGGPTQADATARAAATRKALSDDLYGQGMRARSTDLGAAIRYWEDAVKLDPQNTRAADRLREARAAQQKLERLGKQ